jgi:hypothetical protein
MAKIREMGNYHVFCAFFSAHVHTMCRDIVDTGVDQVTMAQGKLHFFRKFLRVQTHLLE